jgi:hypothetical protein
LQSTSPNSHIVPLASQKNAVTNRYPQRLAITGVIKPSHGQPKRVQNEGKRQMKTHSSRTESLSLKNFAGLLVALSTLLLSSCAMDGGPVIDDLKKTQQLMEAQGDPRTFVDEMRRYALEKLVDLSNKEAQIINTNTPEINSNYDETQFSFAWKVSEDYYIEVLSTPAPCIPISAFRTKQVKYM